MSAEWYCNDGGRFGQRSKLSPAEIDRAHEVMMPILIQGESGAQSVSPVEFSNELELELVLKEHPELLQDDNDVDVESATRVAFVDSQLHLPEGAGILDLLFVTSDGLPVAVEVKLLRNAQARREVVAQAIDYLSALTSLTVDELDELVGGRLQQELQKLVPPSDDKGFDRLWRSVGTNLRAGRARLVVALDDAPSGLERIFRFLTDHASLDVQLVTVGQYPSKAGKVFVSRTRVDFASSAQASRNGGREAREPLAQLLAVFDEYNANAPEDVRAAGTARNYRMIHVGGWPKYVGYIFTQRPTSLIVALYSGRNAPPSLAKVISGFHGKHIAGQVLAWDPGLRDGWLMAKFPLDTSPQAVADAMRDLVFLTRTAVDAELMRLIS